MRLPRLSTRSLLAMCCHVPRILLFSFVPGKHPRWPDEKAARACRLQKSPAFRAWTAQKNGARQRDRATIWAVRALVGAAWVALLLFLGWRLLLSVEQPHETSNMSQQLPFLESGPDIAEQLTFPEGTYQEMPSGLADQPDVDFLAPAVEPEAVTSTIGEAGQTTGADAVPEPAFLDSCLQEEAEAVSVPPVELQLVSLPRLSLLEMAARCAGIPLAIAACIFLARTLTLHQILSAWSGLLNHAQRLRKVCTLHAVHLEFKPDAIATARLRLRCPHQCRTSATRFTTLQKRGRWSSLLRCNTFTIWM